MKSIQEFSSKQHTDLKILSIFGINSGVRSAHSIGTTLNDQPTTNIQLSVDIRARDRCGLLAALLICVLVTLFWSMRAYRPSALMQHYQIAFVQQSINHNIDSSNNSVVSIPNYAVVSDTSILVTSSLIPTHPSIHMINETLNSLPFLQGLPPNSPIVVSIDGWNGKGEQSDLDRLKQYVTNLKESAYGQMDHVTVVMAPEHLHILGNIQLGLTHVHTKYVYVIQHDFPFAKEIQHLALIQTMEEYSDMVQIVRFQKGINVRLPYDKDGCFDQTYPVSHINGIHLTKTPSWSDNNHLTTKEYYQDVVIKEALRHRRELYTAPERFMLRLSTENCSQYGPFLYGLPGDGPFLEHLDGRRSQHIPKPSTPH